ncbi:MAG: deaminase [SAR324 cluster bacterium]|uniref:Deaminase n=1 Tax=SAR324 cluster bacterium TaxID=2024889 RepID=A0A7X9FPP0_9DELT|nr:deaminase [SAR324 cluster bacterium]
MEAKRPYITLNIACSLNGYIGRSRGDRLILSSEEDLDVVDELRAQSDAILVGAETVRRDNPRLLIRDPKRQERRVAVGRPLNPCKVTLSRSGNLDSDNHFFQMGPSARLLYCADSASSELRGKLGGVAEVISAGASEVNLNFLLSDLLSRGISKLLVEGGASIFNLFFKKRCFDELRLAIAPFVLGEEDAVHLFEAGKYELKNLQLSSTEILGAMAVLHYKA